MPSLKVKHGEDMLVELDTIEIRLENGVLAKFEVADEVGIPDDLNEFVDAAKKAPARLAFWAAQLARANFKVREADRKLTKVTGDAALVARIDIQEGRPGELIAAWEVEQRVNAMLKVNEAREQLNKLRLDYELIKSIHDATSHRVYALNRLIERFDLISP